MYSSLIGKIEKARRYAQERHRIAFRRFTVSFRGEHGLHTVDYDEGQWRCDCPFFSRHGTCSHTMALQQALGEMLPGPREGR